MDRTVAADESASYAVLCGVSELEGRPISDLPVLQGTVDADALDSLIPDGGHAQFEGAVSFRYSDTHVVVRGDSITFTAVPENETESVPRE